MKNVLLLLAAALVFFSGAVPALAAQDAAAQADPPEATKAWEEWTKQTDAAKKLQMAIDLLKTYPGTLSAENVSGTSYNDKTLSNEPR